MTIQDLQKSMLFMFAVREAGPGASVEMMKVIALCIRNRVRAGWHNGSWLENIENAAEYSAHSAPAHSSLDVQNRSVQRFLQAVDDIYFGATSGIADDGTDADTWGAAKAGGESVKYWCHLNRPILDTFKRDIIQDQHNHKERASMGLMLFYE